MTERDVPFLQGGNYTAAEVRRIVSALTGAPDFVDLNPSTSPLVSAGGGHGVVRSTDMAVTAGAGTTVNVAEGLALVRGTQQSDQGVYVTSNDAPKNLTISAADATNPRKDLIVSRVKDAEYGISGDTGPLEVVSGTPTGGLTAGNATGRPTPPENALILAEVFVPAAAASSASYTITDLRTRAYALGATAVCKSTTRPTSIGEGQVIYELDTNREWFYDGAAWRLARPVVVVGSRTSGDATFNTATDAPASAAAMSTPELVLPVTVGDRVEIGASGRWGTEAPAVRFAPFSWVSGALLNQLAGGTSGVAAWRGGASVETPFGGSVFATIVAGDLVSGVLTIRFAGWTSTAANKVLSASASVPFEVFAINHGPAA